MHKVFNELVQIFHNLQPISGFRRFEKRPSSGIVISILLQRGLKLRIPLILFEEVKNLVCFVLLAPLPTLTTSVRDIGLGRLLRKKSDVTKKLSFFFQSASVRVLF